MNKIIISIMLRLSYAGFYLYLWYKVLQHINATELMWFLYILIVPFAALVVILEEAIKD